MVGMRRKTDSGSSAFFEDTVQFSFSNGVNSPQNSQHFATNFETFITLEEDFVDTLFSLVRKYSLTLLFLLCRRDHNRYQLGILRLTRANKWKTTDLADCPNPVGKKAITSLPSTASFCQAFNKRKGKYLVW